MRLGPLWREGFHVNVRLMVREMKILAGVILLCECD